MTDKAPVRKAPAAPAEPIRRGGFDVAAFLRSWWPLVLVLAIAGAAAGLTASRFITPRFLATAQIFIDPRGLQIFENELTPRQQDANTAVNFVESQARIIMSQSVLARVVEQERLVDDPEFGGRRGAAWAVRLLRMAGLRDDREDTLTDRERAAHVALYERTSVRRPERTFVIDVTVRADSAEKAARLANAVARAYQDAQNDARAEQARRATQSLTVRLDELRERARISEDRLEDFRRRNGLVGTRLQLVSEQQLTDANTQLATAQGRAAEAQARFDQTQAARRNGGSLASLPEGVISQAVASLRAQQAEARRRLADAQSDFGPRHPTVRNAQAQLADIDRAIVDELERIAQSTRVDLERARAAEAATRRQVEQLSAQASQVSQAQVQLREFQREVDANRNLLNQFLSRSRETDELTRLDSSNTRVITVAQPPRERSFPPRGVIAALAGFVVGLMLGLVAALGLEMLGRRERDADGQLAFTGGPRYV